MKKEVPVRIWVPLILLALCGVAWAIVPASRMSGVQMTSNATTPVVATKQGLWVDTAALPQLRFDDGTNSNYVAAVPATTKGDLAIFTGAKWVRLGVGSNTQVLTADSTQTSGIKWAAGGGGGSTGNWSFSTNNADLTGAAAMGIGGTTATSVVLGAASIPTTVSGVLQVNAGLTASGSTSNDFSGSSGTLKLPTGGIAQSGGSVVALTATDAAGIKVCYGTGCIYNGVFGNNETDIIPNTGSGNFFKFLSTSVTPDTDKTQALGTTAKRFGSTVSLYGDFGGTAGEQPSCTSAIRGAIYAIAAAGGSSDTLQVCDKSAADVYAWRTIFTAP